MKKRLLSWLLVLTMVVGLLPTVALAADYTQADIINGVWLTWDTIKDDNTEQTAVTSDLLLTTMEGSGTYASVSWESNDTDVISISSAWGVVTRPAYGEDDVDVTLTATITKGSMWQYGSGNNMDVGEDMPTDEIGTKIFEVTVLAETEEPAVAPTYTDQELVDGAKELFELTDVITVRGTSDIADLDALTYHFNDIPYNYNYVDDMNGYIDEYEDITYEWSSTGGALGQGTSLGTVIRTTEDQEGTITLTLTLNEATATKSWDYKVLAFSDDEKAAETTAMTEIAAALDFEDIKYDNTDADAVTGDLFAVQNAKYSGEDIVFDDSTTYHELGANITWTSSNTSIISATPEWNSSWDDVLKVIQPQYDTGVTLTATLTSPRFPDLVTPVTKDIVVTVAGTDGEDPDGGSAGGSTGGGSSDPAPTYGDPVDVVIMAQQDGKFLQLPTTVAVSGELSETYGITTDETEMEATVLDALVAAHIAVYGNDFTATTASDYMDGSSWISKAFQTATYNFSFAVNNAMPNDGVIDEDYGTYTGYTADQAVLAKDDVVSFFFNDAASSYCDYLTWFAADKYEAISGEDLKVSLKGYNYMTYGCSDDLADQAVAITSATIATVDENGTLTATTFTTDANGEATISFDTAGTYIISATGTMAETDYYGDDVDAAIFCPVATVEVSASLATDVTITDGETEVTELALMTGQSSTLVGTVTTSDESEVVAKWKSSNEEVATVSDAGVVTAVGGGEATITAYAGTFSDTVTVTVTGITVSMPDSVWYGADEAYHAFATSDEDFTHQFTTNIEDPVWSSSSSYVAIDAETGLVTATPYSATSYRSAKLTVKSAADSSISYTTDTIYFYYPMAITTGDTYTFTYAEDGLSTPSSAYITTGSSALNSVIAWTGVEGSDIITTTTDLTSNPYRFSCAAGNPGTVEVTATFLGENVNNNEATPPSDTITITVEGVIVKDAEGTRESSVALVEGEATPTVQLTATVVDGRTYTWSSSDETVATVDATGLVTAVSAGTAFIYATDSEDSKGGYRIQVTESGKPYFENLQFTTTAFSNWSTSSFAATQTEYDLSIKAYTTVTISMSSATKYDTDLYTATYSYTDSNGDLQEGTVNSGAITYYYNIPFGETTLTVTLAEIEGDAEAVITFNVTRPRDANKYLSTTGIVLVPDGRSLNTSKYDGYAEGTMFKADENGDTLGTTGVATTTYYYRTNLFEGDDTFALKLTTSTSYAWVRYSTDDGTTWSDAVQYSGSTDSITIPTGETTQKVLIQVLDDTTYVAGGNTFVADTATTYTIWVDQVSASPEAAQMATAAFAEGTLYGSSFDNFDSGVYTYSIVLPNANTDGATLTYTLPEGAAAVIGSDTQVANEDGTYTVNWASGTKTIVVTSADSTVSNSYAFLIIKQSGYDVPDAVVDYLVPGSQYTNSTTYGYKPEYMLSGSLKSLGNFGGYVTFYYEDGITNDPNNLYGLDFYVKGNAFAASESAAEPGQVWVSEDNITWYALAGSEHYEDDTITDYTITYTKDDSGKAAWVDSEGNSGTGTYNFPGEANYPLYDFGDDPDTITLTGVLLPSALGFDDKTTANYATLPAFGYVDASAGVGTTISTYSVNDTNVYTASPSTGEGFDLAWAVDADGQPIDVTGKEFNYVKVVTASHIYAGMFGEKSTEVTYVIRTTAQEEAVGVTDAPTGITISSAVGDQTVNFVDGTYTYDVNVGSAKYLSIAVNGADETDNIYVNNQRIASDAQATGFVVSEGNDKTVRVIVQNGDKEPVIYILNLTSSASSEGDGIEAVYANVGGSSREATKGNDGNYTLSVAYTIASIGISATTTESYTINDADVADSYDLVTGDNVFTLETASGQTVTLTVTKAEAPTSTSTINVYVTVYAPAGEYDPENPLVFSDSKSGFEAILSKTKITVTSGSTAWVAIQEALDDAGIDYENASGNYISSINGLAEFDRGSLSGWLYTVDGEYPAYGVNEYVLSSSDSIILHYTEDYTQEEASESFSGSNSGGSSSNTPTTEEDTTEEDTTATTTTTTITTTTATATTTTEATVDSDGKASATVDSDAVTTAIEEVIASANEAEGETVKEVKLEVTADGDATSVEATIPESTVSDLNEKVDVVTLETPVATISLDADTLTTIADEASGDVSIKAAVVTIPDNTPDEVASMIGDNNVYSFEITSGDKKISEFGGAVTVSIPYTLKDGEDARKLTVYYIAEDGSVKEMPATYDADKQCMVMTTTHFSVFGVAYDESKIVFDDVDTAAWFYDAVAYVVNAGLFNGTSETTFAPDDTMTRAMIWMVLARNSGIDTTADGDVWYEVGRAWAMETGVSDGTNPDGSVTREQLAAMLYRYAVENGEDVSVGESTNILSYTDVADVAEYAISAMQWACGAGIIKGTSESTLSPTGNATRAQVATILMRYLEQ